mgnify:FL=1
MGRSGLALACAALLGSGVAHAAESPALAPYATYVRGAAGMQLLDTVREALCVAAGRCDTLRTVAPDWPAAPRPMFVTLARGRATRACLGRDGSQGSLTATVRAIAADLLVADRRHPPVAADELAELRVLVAFVGDERPLADPFAIDPMREGLRIETERGAVAFLPGEARTVAWALGEARRIGVLGAMSEARFIRFAAVVVSGPAAIPADPIAPSSHSEVHP